MTMAMQKLRVKELRYAQIWSRPSWLIVRELLSKRAVFVSACPENLFTDLSRAPVRKFLKTLKEINIAFIPYEEQVNFSPNCCNGCTQNKPTILFSAN